MSLRTSGWRLHALRVRDYSGIIKTQESPLLFEAIDALVRGSACPVVYRHFRQRSDINLHVLKQMW